MTLLFALFIFFLSPSSANAAVNIPLTVNLSETVNVTGTPRIAVDVGGTTRYATYTSGTGSNTLTFTLSPQAGDVDLDGVTVSSPIDLNGGTIKDVKGNNAALTFTPPSTTNVKVNYPSLGMDFVYDADGRYTLNGTAYNDLSSFLTAAGGSFTRASIGTYFDSTGTLQTAASGVPRFDYDPVTHAAKGILIEESRMNLATYSDEITSTRGWSNVSASNATVVPNVANAPDGSTTADELTFGGLNTWWGKSFNVVSGQTYSVSVWVKVADAGADFNFDLRYYSPGGGALQVKSLPATSSWTRVTATFSSVTVGTGLTFAVIKSDTTRKIDVWGVQIEQGSFPTSYIPTTNVVVTRAADNLTIPTGGWLDASKGTLYNEGYQSYLVTSHPTYLSSLSTGTSSDFIATYLTTGAAKSGALNVGGTDYYNLGSGTYIAGNLLKSAITYKANDVRMSADGSLAALVSSGPLPSTTLLYIGDRDGTRTWNGHIRKTKYYPIRVTDTQLQLLTQ